MFAKMLAAACAQRSGSRRYYNSPSRALRNTQVCNAGHNTEICRVVPSP
jgi:hypothetical protein